MMWIVALISPLFLTSVAHRLLPRWLQFKWSQCKKKTHEGVKHKVLYVSNIYSGKLQTGQTLHCFMEIK